MSTRTIAITRPRAFALDRKPTHTVVVALYGYGTVGSALARIIAQRSEWLRRSHGISIAVKHVAVRDLERERIPAVAREQITRECERGVRDASVDIVVELMGGTGVALDVAQAALAYGKHLVTANKAVIAQHGSELEALALRQRALLRYEAAVGGAIPILRVLRTSLATDRITRVRGIINGTTNYILSRMDEDGLPFFRALGKAGALGYAEADPTADVSGADAAQKLVILARHAFQQWLPLSVVSVEGIESVSLDDFRIARARGCTLKLIADAETHTDGVALRVGVEEIALSDPLATVRNELNAIQLETENAGQLVFTGRGAGGVPTASAVYNDLIEVACATVCA